MSPTDFRRWHAVRIAVMIVAGMSLGVAVVGLIDAVPTAVFGTVEGAAPWHQASLVERVIAWGRLTSSLLLAIAAVVLWTLAWLGRRLIAPTRVPPGAAGANVPRGRRTRR